MYIIVMFFFSTLFYALHNLLFYFSEHYIFSEPKPQTAIGLTWGNIGNGKHSVKSYDFLILYENWLGNFSEWNAQKGSFRLGLSEWNFFWLRDRSGWYFRRPCGNAMCLLPCTCVGILPLCHWACGCLHTASFWF